MLKSIGLKNYKCFENKTNIEIAPLTVLCGANSSGKSSILKSLLMLKQSYENINSTNNMTFNGNYVDNGSFNDIKNNTSNYNCFTISNKFNIEKQTDSNFTKEKTILRDLSRLFYNNNITRFEIENTLEIIKSDGFINPNKLNTILITIKSWINEEIINKCVVKMTKVKDKDNKYMLECEGVPDVSGFISDFEIPYCTCYFSGMTLNSIYKENIDSNKKVFIPSIITIFKIVSSQYDLFNYIAPLRETPQRNYIIEKDINSVGISGYDTPLLLKKVSNRPWNGLLAPENEDDNFLQTDIKRVNFIELLQSWMSYFEFGSVNLDDTQRDIVKININNHNISDVGFGVSQALPILTEGLFMSRRQTLLLEQPEIHLHPKMQMKMADFLLSMVMQDKQIVVETHSDHIINRLVRRIIQDESGLLGSNISIIFLTKNNDGTNISPITIDSARGIVNWPDGFFDQFQSEQEKIIRAGIEKRKYLRQLMEN